ncbi:hypothetical protein ACH4C6_18750 [Streptomyces sp. NPDC017943]|uniref:hypothetical protein n=1 Tax=Streptomyces sp. NPDC017943 TaxID=3365019 RepID=UPI0037B5BCD9
MAKVFERTYGEGTSKRNFYIFAASSALLYLLALILGMKGGWDAALPLLAVAVIIDALVFIAWIAFRPKGQTR